MKLKNVEMDAMIATLEHLLKYNGLVGYAAARNIRILRETAHEYLKRKEELIRQYGKPELDEDGNPTGRIGIAFDSPEFAGLKDNIGQIASIEHDAPVYTIPIADVRDVISGDEMLAVDWMFTGWEDE